MNVARSFAPVVREWEYDFRGRALRVYSWNGLRMTGVNHYSLLEKPVRHDTKSRIYRYSGRLMKDR